MLGNSFSLTFSLNIDLSVWEYKGAFAAIIFSQNCSFKTWTYVSPCFVSFCHFKLSTESHLELA